MKSTLPKVNQSICRLWNIKIILFFLEIELYRRKKLNVKQNSGASVSFMITTIKVGFVEIKVTANSPKNQDVAVKQLLVTVSLDIRSRGQI